MRKKKAQLGILGTWITAIIIIFSIVVIWKVWINPFQTIDDKITPKIDAFTVNGKSNTDLLPGIRNANNIIPLILIGGTLLWAFAKSVTQDPNYTYR